MITRKSFIDALIVAMIWIIGYWIARVFAQGMEASTTYAVVVGWWFTAYMTSRFNLSISLLIPLFIGYFLLFTFAAIIEEPWFYRDIYLFSFSDISFSSLLFFLVIASLQSFFICSPVIFDFLFRKIVCICSRICSRKSDSDMGASRWSHDHSM